MTQRLIALSIAAGLALAAGCRGDDRDLGGTDYDISCEGLGSADALCTCTSW